jgi:hypothetical protein
VQADPLVQAVLTRFPGAEIVGVHLRGEPAAADLPLAADDVPPPPDEADDDL